MTTKELLEKAKAKGGWRLMPTQTIRTFRIFDPTGLPCCPIAAVLGCKNSDVDEQKKLRKLSASAIVLAADNSVKMLEWFLEDAGSLANKSMYALAIRLRKEMESWTKCK